MSARSKNIGEQIVAFRNSRKLSQLKLALNALEQGPFRNLHFDSVKRVLIDSAAATPEKLFVELTDNTDGNPSLPLIHRRLQFCNVYMTTHVQDSDALTPVTHRAEMTSHSFYSCSRPIPLVLSAGHTEFRHIQRTSKTLQYNDDPFRFATAFSLPLAAVLQKQAKDDGFVPCVIPHDRGFFLGTTSTRTVEMGQEMDAFIAVRDIGPKGRMDAGQANGSTLTFTAQTNVLTFISRREFSNSQHELYDLLRPMMEDRKTLEALGYGLDMYSWGPLGLEGKKTTLAEINAWGEVCDRLAVVVRSSEWQRETTFAMKTFGRLERN